MSRPVKERALPFREEHAYLFTDPIFLIGNGKSRENFDLERLRGKGTIIGCNALYRDFTPDILISIDSKMINELRSVEYMKDNLVVVPANRNAQHKDVLKWRTSRYNTSGCFGIKLIHTILKPKNCYMLGMDAYPGNLYDATPNYSVNTLQNFSGVIKFYLQELKEQGNNTTFINVNTKNTWEGAEHTGRYEFITYEEFEKRVFNNGPVAKL